MNEEPVHLQISPDKQNGELYIALDPILSYYGIQYSILPKTNAIEIIKDGKKKITRED